MHHFLKFWVAESPVTVRVKPFEGLEEEKNIIWRKRREEQIGSSGDLQSFNVSALNQSTEKSFPSWLAEKSLLSWVSLWRDHFDDDSVYEAIISKMTQSWRNHFQVDSLLAEIISKLTSMEKSFPHWISVRGNNVQVGLASKNWRRKLYMISALTRYMEKSFPRLLSLRRNLF